MATFTRFIRLRAGWRKTQQHRSITLFFTLLLCAWPAYSATKIPFYTYYAGPPFAIDWPGNLTVRLAKWLTLHSGGHYEFEAKHLPRPRLDVLMAQPHWEGVVAWANPIWFDDPKQQTYLWSRPFMHDANLIASHRDKPIEFRNSDSLNGLKLGGILGRRYNDFDAQLNSGKIVREDASNEEQNLQKLHHGRVDVIFMQASSLVYYRRIYPDLDQWLYIATKPRRNFQRHLLTDKHAHELMQFLNAMLVALAKDPDWRHYLVPQAPTGWTNQP